MRDSRDSDLLKKLQAGDDSALADLVDAYSARIYQLAFRYLRNREDAEELTQDVLFKVYSNVGSFRGDSALSSWIYRITFNAAMSRLRAFKQDLPAAPERPDSEHHDPPAKDVVDSARLADEEVHRREMRQVLVRALRDLPALYRVPVILRDVKGLTTEEASAVLHVKEQTLKSRLHRGRLILRKQLADFAGGLSLHRPLYGT